MNVSNTLTLFNFDEWLGWHGCEYATLKKGLLESSPSVEIYRNIDDEGRASAWRIRPGSDCLQVSEKGTAGGEEQTGSFRLKTDDELHDLLAEAEIAAEEFSGYYQAAVSAGDIELRNRIRNEVFYLRSDVKLFRQELARRNDQPAAHATGSKRRGD